MVLIFISIVFLSYHVINVTIKVLNEINSRFRFLYRKQNILNDSLRRLLCNVLIQPHFDYACQVWFPNLTKELSNKIQCAQNKYIRLCLSLSNRACIGKRQFCIINWLPVNKRLSQHLCITPFKYFNNTFPSYTVHIYLFVKLIWCRKPSYSGPKIWNSLQTELKLAKSWNIFKHKLKAWFFNLI